MSKTTQFARRCAAAKGAQVKVFVRELKKQRFDNEFFRTVVLAGQDKDCAYRLFIAGLKAYLGHQNDCLRADPPEVPAEMPEFDDVQAELEERWQEQSVEKLQGENAALKTDVAVKQKRLERKQQVIERLGEVIDQRGGSLPEGIDPEEVKPQKKEPSPLPDGVEDDESDDPTHWSMQKLMEAYRKRPGKLSEEELHERMVDQVHDAMLAEFWPDEKERNERKREMLSSPNYDAFKNLIGLYVSQKKLTRQQAVSMPFARAAHYYISFKKTVTADSLNTVLYRYFKKKDPSE